MLRCGIHEEGLTWQVLVFCDVHLHESYNSSLGVMQRLRHQCKRNERKGKPMCSQHCKLIFTCQLASGGFGIAKYIGHVARYLGYLNSGVFHVEPNADSRSRALPICMQRALDLRVSTEPMFIFNEMDDQAIAKLRWNDDHCQRPGKRERTAIW